MVEGLITLRSQHPPKETAGRLAAALASHGMTLVASVDHAAAAAKVGLDLRPTEVLIFGNPSAGTLLMQAAQTVGIELPLKALVWQDDAGSSGYHTKILAGSRNGMRYRPMSDRL